MLVGGRRILQPAVVLFFLSPMTAELLTSSAPPAEFFNPFGFIIMAALYGSGAVLARELTVRWQKGWPTLLMLGFAFGIFEEGLLVKSFFDPQWPDLGDLGVYGRWLGVNWVWALNLTLWHSVNSIMVPIMLTGLMFPDRRSQSWITPRWFKVLCVFLLGDWALGLFLLTPYRPAVGAYSLTFLVAVGLFLLAKRIPCPLFTRFPQNVRPVRARWFYVVGLAATPAYFLVSSGLSKTSVPPIVNMLLALSLFAAIAAVIVRMAGKGAAWSDRRQLAFATGLLTFYVILAPVWEVNNSARPDNTAGMSIVGIAAAIFLIWIARHVVQREAAQVVPASPCDNAERPPETALDAPG